VNGEIANLYKRIDDVDKNIGKRMDGLEGRMDRLDVRMGSNFKWTMGMLFAMFAMIITMWMMIIMAIKG
jgi:hypothetical protein